MLAFFSRIALTLGGSAEASIVTKATVLLAAVLIGTRLARGARASVRHVWLASMFGVLLLLPAAVILMPQVAMRVPVARVASPVAVLAGGTDIELVTPAAERVPQQTTVGHRDALLSVRTLLVAGWGAGVVIFLLPLCAALWRLRAVRGRGLPWLEGEPLLQRLACDAGIRRSVAVLLHEQLAAPMTCGFFRPAIVLPADAREWSHSDLHHALVHELEHVHRADWPVHLVARVACAVHWFHPLAWMAWRQLGLESERACDDAVLVTSDRTAYAEQLVSLARRLLTERARPVLSMANRTDLSARVSAVLDRHQRRGRAGRVRIGMIVATVGALALVIAPLGAVEEPGASSPALVQSPAGADARPASGMAASIQRLAPDWRMDETDHFSVFFASSINSEIDQVKREVERAYNVVSAELRHDVPFQPVLVVFSTTVEMERGSSAASLAATLGALPPPDKRVLIAVDMTPATRNSELVRQIRVIFDRDIATSKPRAQAGSASTLVGLDFLADLDFGDFCCPEYLTMMIERIKANWHTQEYGRPVVRFTVQRDGQIRDVAIEQSSGSSSLDLAAQRAVTATKQLPPLPSQFPNQTLRVRVGIQSQSQLQTSAGTPTFEVASVKANKSGDLRTLAPPPQPGGRYAVTNVPLDVLIALAYQPLQRYEIAGVPDWARSARFDIDAKAEGNPAPGQTWLMLRSLLAERFKLAVHREVRQLPVYALMMTKDGQMGPQLRRHTDDAGCDGSGLPPAGPPSPDRSKPLPPPPCGAWSGAPALGRLAGQRIMLDTFGRALSGQLGRMVLDQTGLSGAFDLTLDWTPQQPLAGSPAADASAPTASSLPSIFTAVQEQLGLKLVPQTGPVSVLVIDHVEEPTDN